MAYDWTNDRWETPYKPSDWRKRLLKSLAWPVMRFGFVMMSIFHMDKERVHRNLAFVGFYFFGLLSASAILLVLDLRGPYPEPFWHLTVPLTLFPYTVGIMASYDAYRVSGK